MNDGDNRAGVLTRLVQHIELNKSGWWEQAVVDLVLASLYALVSGSKGDIRDRMVEICGGPPDSDLVASTITDLIASGSIRESDGLLRLSEELREELTQQEAATLRDEAKVRDRFKSMAQNHGLGDRSEELWSVMETEVIHPIVRNMGARMYQLLTAGRADGRDALELEMDEFLSQLGEPVRLLFVAFLDPNKQDVRRFVLKRLNARYVIDAAALSHDALEQLRQLKRRARRVDVFLDTNFLFSVLGLHRNPGDDTANELMRLLPALESRVKLNLYVLEDTYKETRQALRGAILEFQEFRGQPNLAAAARPLTSSLMRLYLEAAAHSPTAMTVEEFFGPYESNLLRLLRSKSVELYKSDLSYLRRDQEVVDDVHDMEEEQKMYRQRGAKPYEANLHDMVLWHFTKSKRDTIVESPLEVTAWVVTLDYQLIKFDKHKNRQGAHAYYEPPICLDPASLIQLFQFWIPSTAELDEALVGSVRQPLLLLKFDSPSEDVTIRILTQLSRYEKAEEFTTDMAAAILTSAALRGRLSRIPKNLSMEEQRVEEEKAISESIQHLTHTLGQELEQLKERVVAAEASTEAAEERAARHEVEQALAAATESLHGLEDENRCLTDEIADIRSRLTDLEGRDIRKKENRRFGVISSLSVLVAIGLFFGSSLFDESSQAILVWVVRVVGAIVLLLGIEFASRQTHFMQSPILKRLPRLNRWWWKFLLAVGASVIANWLFEGLT